MIPYKSYSPFSASNQFCVCYILQLVDTLHMGEVKTDIAVARVQVCHAFFVYVCLTIFNLYN